LILKVGLMEALPMVRFEAATAAKLTLGQIQRRVPAGTLVKVERLSGTPAVIRYQVAIKTFPHDQLAGADAALAGMLEQGIPAILVPHGERLVGKGGEQIHDHRRIFLVVAETLDLATSEQLLQTWTEAGERPFVHETRLVAPSARVRVTVGGEVLEGEAPVGFYPKGKRVRVRDVEFGHHLRKQGTEDRDYHGNLLADADRFGTLAAVNQVELEKYLQGVVPAEIGPSSALPALRAQAVAARGETLAKLGLKWGPDPYDTCATVRCQVYSGIGRETERTNQAVADTRGVVMREGQRIVDAVYAAVCGGHTEANEAVWSSPPDPALRPRRDGPTGIPSPVTDSNIEDFLAHDIGWCKGTPKKSRWRRSFTQAELRSVLAEKAEIEVGEIKNLVILGRGTSGRLSGLKVVGSRGSFTIRKELPIRRAFGNLRSALFVMDLKRDGSGRLLRVTFRGAGWGHGVGLCQIGARVQAKAGRPYQAILKSYYSDISLDRVDH
jgi:SpoIID/LytB domain protein